MTGSLLVQWQEQGVHRNPWLLIFFSPGGLKGNSLYSEFRRSPCSVFEFCKAHVLTVLGELIREEFPRWLFLKSMSECQLHRGQRRNGMEGMCIWVSIVLWGGAGVRAEVASYLAQLARKCLVQLRWEEEGTMQGLYWLTVKSEIGFLILCSCVCRQHFVEIFWLLASISGKYQLSVGAGQSVSAPPHPQSLLPVGRWMFCWLPSSYFGGCVLDWKGHWFSNLEDLVLTPDSPN